MSDSPKPISGYGPLDDYLRTRLTDREQEETRQTYADGDPEGSEAIINQANIRNGSGQPRT